MYSYMGFLMPPALDLRPWGLHPLLETNVRALDAQFPDTLTVISGARDLRRQCHAMAANIAIDRDWLIQTYTRKDRPSGPLAQLCQGAINAQPDVVSIQGLADILLATLAAAPLGSMISWHTFELLGKAASLAVDFQATEALVNTVTTKPTELGEQIRKFAATLPHYDAFLFKESGLARLHYQIFPVTLRPVQAV